LHKEIKQLVKKEVRIHSLKFASLLVKRNQEDNTQSTQKKIILSKRSILVLKSSQVKDDKVKHTLSQRTTTKLKKFEKIIKKSSKQES